MSIIQFSNPYLEEILPELSKNIFDQRFEVRREMVKKYAWAIPNQEAIEVLVEHSPVLEIGAGTGYWASLAAAAGCDILCYDIEPHTNHWCENNFYHVEVGGAEKVDEHPDRTLFLCWPPYEDRMALACLTHYKGDKFIYVGENWGCTGCDDFRLLYEKEWKIIKEVSIPQWWGMHDYLMVFERKSQSPTG